MPDYTDLMLPYKDILEQFKHSAPGSYKHCEFVAALVMSISDELKIDCNDLYIAARLHDIGKMLNPMYFTENQIDGKNIHDNLDVMISYQYISRHVSDSVMLLVSHENIPINVLRIISQHHGDSCIRSLLNKISDNNSCNVTADDLRYKCEKPKSTHACILMICDVIEAATRSKFTNNKLHNIKETINQLIGNLIDDCQIDYLTIGQLRIIKEILIDNIVNMYHSRIAYDDTSGDVADIE